MKILTTDENKNIPVKTKQLNFKMIKLAVCIEAGQTVCFLTF